jgi:hypothetical protein
MWPGKGNGLRAAIPSSNEVPFIFVTENYGLTRCGKRKRRVCLHRFCKNDARKKKDSFSGVSLHAVCPGGDLLRGAANLLKYRDLMRKEGGRLLPLQVHGEQTQDRDPLLIALAAINGVFYSESIQTLQAKPGLRNAVR